MTASRRLANIAGRTTTLAAVVWVLAAAGTARADGDYIAQARLVYRIAACGAGDPVPARFHAKPLARHCKRMTALYASHRKRWAGPARRFIAELRPDDAPRTVVYPFGGGDLSSALVAFPDATEITTVSLEAAGDVRIIERARLGTLAGDLGVLAGNLRRLYRSAYSATKSLQAASRDPTFPGTLFFAFAGLALHDMEPVAMRYFDLRPDGSIAYPSARELERRAAEYAATRRGRTPPRKVTHYWYAHDSAFGNVEIAFRPRGEPTAPVRIYRHIVQNLDDAHLRADGRVLAHLRAKGKVSVMTKAASFLLWYDDFTLIRNHLLASIAWMISDASGIPPGHAGPAGYEQITYGEFAGPLFVIDPNHTRAQFVRLWRSQPRRPLPFRFGYPDVNKRPHLMVTRPKHARP